MNEAEYLMKNQGDRGVIRRGRKPRRMLRRMLYIELKAEVDNTLLDLHNSSYYTKAEFNNCFIIHSK